MSNRENPHDFHVAMDVCRPGSDDLSQAELAEFAAALESDDALREQYRRLQTFDAAVGQAFQDVPVPEGEDPE